MAVKYNEIKGNLETDPLTEDEKSFIDFVEAYIDTVIKEKFDNDPIKIDLTIVNFRDFPPRIGVSIDKRLKLNSIKNTRKSLMRKELDRRYTLAEWDIIEQFDDIAEKNYWILRGK